MVVSVDRGAVFHQRATPDVAALRCEAITLNSIMAIPTICTSLKRLWK